MVLTFLAMINADPKCAVQTDKIFYEELIPCRQLDKLQETRNTI